MTESRKTAMKRYIVSNTGDREDEILDQLPQEFTSENTSINFTKVPAVFRLVSDWRPGTVNLDYGGGRADTAAEYLAPLDVINLVYDPYNRTREHNQEVVKLIRKHGGADTATCSNVLNVIKEPEVRLNVLENIHKLVKPSGTVYITVYEGSGKGNEGPTKAGYQLNKKTADYLDEIRQVFPDAVRKGKLIICHPDSAIKSSVTCSSVNTLESKIKKAVKQTLKGHEFGFSDDEVDKYSQVDVEYQGDQIRIEVRAEIDFDGLMTLAESMDKIIKRYDPDAYFDAVEPGILEATITRSKVNSATNTVNTPAKSDYITADDTSDHVMSDSISEDYLKLYIDDDIVVDEDGNFSFVDDSYPWVSTTSDGFDVDVDDEDNVIENCHDLLEPFIPVEPGNYRISCEIGLRYRIYGDEEAEYRSSGSYVDQFVLS